MTAVDPSLFDIAPSAQDLFQESRLGANLLSGAAPGPDGPAAGPRENPAELGDDALVDFTSAAQNWFNTEQQDDVPDSVISVQSMLSTLVGSMTANATTAMATAAEVSPDAAYSLTQP